ncbi:MAG: hypothetical protein C0467_32260 [Planctomycetaceae bacterium]|nr:hypothetical protein [Planctomycetaceae bacterium]
MTTINFDEAFHVLTGNPPFPWQKALYERFISDRPDNIPSSCNLPTGLGKTSVIAVWLIALTNHPDKMPRRLVYVVNRRTVVDQTTTEVEKYRTNRAKAGIPEVLAISTLRGQFADNREWSADPSRPAVICGTVDMIGSRLLFSGYGCGFKTRPLHAGFLGQDSLLVHDEAHLEPAFQMLIEAIQKEQARCKDLRPMKVMELTATSRGEGEVFGLTDADRANTEVHKRINAKKTIHLVENKDEKKYAEEIADLTLNCGKRHPDTAIIVFVRKVDDVEKIVKKLPKDSSEQLTGTLRGLERDGLVRKPVFQRFLPPSNRAKDVPPQSGTVYLVCTSAGEVGVNISADHLVCALSTFESMAQRFGRVNRFGERDDTEIHIIYPTKFEDEKPPQLQMRNTLALLQSLKGNGSPTAIGSLDQNDRLAAFAPTPTILPTSDILFDSWALTTINRPLVKAKLPGRPPVELYLHGVAEWQPPEAHVAWREEVELITGDLLTEYEPEDLLAEYALKPHELLGDNVNRIFDRLKKLKAKATTPVWIVDEDDSVEVTTLGTLIEAGKDELNDKTVLLPPSAGGLANGFLTSESLNANDVSGELHDEEGNPRRLRVWDNAEASNNMRLILTIDTKPDTDEAEDESSGGRLWKWYELRKGGDGEGVKNSKLPVLWNVHTDDVVCNTRRIVEKLPLPEDLKKAVIFAAECHDLGKKRKLFQTVLGNREYPSIELAKSGKKGGRAEERYRHEFGSLIDTEKHPEFDSWGDLKEFVLHIIATHHGRGRPHFPANEAFDPERSDAAAVKVARETPQRYAHLQRKYGRWGLAYLESLLRAADYAASAKPSAFMEEKK